MTTSNQKISLLVPSQLPEYIRDNPDYSNFVTFLQAYYEWMEQNGNVIDATKNLLNYTDIDNTSDEFINYFINDFLPYFPEDALISKEKAVKVARELYQSKGTPASYKFLFRILYDSDFDYFNTGDATLKASDGSWYVPKSLKLATVDPRFLQLNTTNSGNYKVFGQTSKSFATIEYVLLAGNKMEIFISDIERLFESGEIVKIVDSKNQDVLINDSNLSAKLVGQISQVNVNPNNRGLFYNVGDPVIIYDGLNSTVENPVSAKAQVQTITSGSIQKISVNNGGYGYSVGNTNIIFSNLNDGAVTPIATVGSVAPTPRANVTYIPSDSIMLKRYHMIGNTASSSGANIKDPTTGLWSNGSYDFANVGFSNASTTLANAFTFLNFATYPISSIVVQNSGGGITSIPTITAESDYGTDDPEIKGRLSSLGILAPIVISNGGQGYVANDVINFIGGSGYGAHANVTSVDANGTITMVDYVYPTGEKTHFPLGGMGYTGSLPSLTVTSSNTSAHGASLYVPSVLGAGADFSVTVDRAGSVTTIQITEPGEDYINTPNVSLRVQDIVVSNISPSLIYMLDRNDIIYQGSNVSSATYYSYYDSIKQLSYNNDPTQSLWNLRVYNYNSQPNPALNLRVIDKNSASVDYIDDMDQDYLINMVMKNTAYPANNFYQGSPQYDNTGVKNYGDGNAKATAKFLNGLLIGEGQYVNLHGQPSGFSVLQNERYNSFTYQITVNKEIQKYRDILLNLLHPTGTNLIGRYSNTTESKYKYTSSTADTHGYNLYNYTQNVYSNAVMSTTFNNPSTNIVYLNNLDGLDISDVILDTSTLCLTSQNGLKFSSKVESVDNVANTVTLKDNVFLSFANVAYVSTTSGSDVINMIKITESYNLINFGAFSNTQYPLTDLVFVGDQIKVNSYVYTVNSVNAIAGTIQTNTNISTTFSNTLISVKKSFTAGGDSNYLNDILIF